ncbi:hypothetical protein LMIY3S_04239 [Labrys miyagiensis]
MAVVQAFAFKVAKPLLSSLPVGTGSGDFDVAPYFESIVSRAEGATSGSPRPACGERIEVRGRTAPAKNSVPAFH